MWQKMNINNKRVKVKTYLPLFIFGIGNTFPTFQLLIGLQPSKSRQAQNYFESGKLSTKRDLHKHRDNIIIALMRKESNDVMLEYLKYFAICVPLSSSVVIVISNQ